MATQWTPPQGDLFEPSPPVSRLMEIERRKALDLLQTLLAEAMRRRSRAERRREAPFAPALHAWSILFFSRSRFLATKVLQPIGCVHQYSVQISDRRANVVGGLGVRGIGRRGQRLDASRELHRQAYVPALDGVRAVAIIFVFLY